MYFLFIFFLYTDFPSFIGFPRRLQTKDEKARATKEKEQLEAVNEMLRKDKKKLENNLAFLTTESQKARHKVEGLEDGVRKAERIKVKVVDELACEKRMYDSAFSQATAKLRKAEAKLATMRGDLE